MRTASVIVRSLPAPSHSHHLRYLPTFFHPGETPDFIPVPCHGAAALPVV